jgi:hypothetical protein
LEKKMPLRSGAITKCKKGAPRRFLVLNDDGQLLFYVNATAQLLSDDATYAAEVTLAVAGAACLDKEQGTMPWTAGVDAARRLQLRERCKETSPATVRVLHNLEAPTAADAEAWAAAINNYVPPTYKAMSPLRKDTLKVAAPAAPAPAGPAPPVVSFTLGRPKWQPAKPTPQPPQPAAEPALPRRQPAAHPVQPPADPGGELLRLGPGQQMAEVERAQRHRHVGDEPGWGRG